MQTDEALALSHLRRWGYERTRLLRGQGRAIKEYATRPGWGSRHAASYDAAQVRCIDFENALSELDPADRVLLIVHYRDHDTMNNAAVAAGVSTRTAYTRCALARRHLAQVLEKKGLL